MSENNNFLDDKDQNILDYSVEELMGDRFGRYAKYIIQDRALPDVRDGLKPVQRRILYTMGELGLFSDKPYKKSARIVGEVIGKYHPHGDSSIYEALVRMSQWWKLNVVLIDMYGNNGSIDGDGAAAMRYTETRLAKVSYLMLNDLKKNSVSFAPNFDDSEIEPTVLPSYFPNILVNGATGIAAGYATNMPPHNFNEVIDATIATIANPSIRLTSLIKIIKGPDFPTGGIVMGKSGILDAFKTGKGKVVIQAKMHFEQQNIVVTEIPYEVIKQDLVKKIGEVAELNQHLEINEVRDETDRNGLRIVIELSKKGNLKLVRKWLLKNTPLQVSYNYNNVVIYKKQPKLMGLISIIKAYIEHLQDVFTKKTKFDLDKAKKRLEIILGLIKAVSILDKVIKIIRKSINRQDAINNLVNLHEFSLVQATAIVDLRLYRLTSTDVVKLNEEKNELEISISYFEKILNDKSFLDQELINLLEDIKLNYSVERRSQIKDEVETIEFDLRETIEDKDYKVWISKDGYLKALDEKQVDLIKTSNNQFNRKPNDMWISTINTNTFDYLILICSNGTYYLVPGYKIVPSKIKDIGMHINKLAPFSGDDTIVNAFLVKSFENAKQEILLTSKTGMTKRVPIEDLEMKSYNKSFKIMRLNENDKIVSASLVTSNTKYILVLTKSGFAVRYKINEIPSTSPSSKGVTTTSSKNEEVVAGRVFDEGDELFIITDRNRIKRIDQNLIPVTSRPKRGSRVIPVNKSKPELCRYLFNVKENDKVKFLDEKDIIQTIKIDQIKKTELTSKPVDIDKGEIVCATFKKSFIVQNGDIPPSIDKKVHHERSLTASFENSGGLNTEDLIINIDDLLDEE